MFLSTQLTQPNFLEKSFHLRFKCQYKEVEDKYLLKKRAAEARCCFDESKTDDPDEASTPETMDDSLTLEDDDILFLCEEVYREDFLKFFKLEHYDDTIVNNKTSELYKVCSKNMLFSLLIHEVKTRGSALDDDECAFMQLFAYPFFYLTHECVKQLILDGAVEEGLKAEIEEKVTSFFSK
jgi:hypothetical protein